MCTDSKFSIANPKVNTFYLPIAKAWDKKFYIVWWLGTLLIYKQQGVDTMHIYKKYYYIILLKFMVDNTNSELGRSYIKLLSAYVFKYTHILIYNIAV